MYKQIILACDGSEHALRANEHATYIAKCSEETNVEVVYVVDNRTAKSDIIQGQTDLETISASRKDKLKEIEGLLKKENISYTITILHGDPGDTIVQYVNTGDMILSLLEVEGSIHCKKWCWEV